MFIHRCTLKTLYLVNLGNTLTIHRIKKLVITVLKSQNDINLFIMTLHLSGFYIDFISQTEVKLLYRHSIDGNKMFGIFLHNYIKQK